MADMRWEVVHFSRVDSTNEVARRLIRAGASPGLVVVADEQSAGRGRRGHRWYSPPGGLWMSVVLPAPGTKISLFPLLIAAAVIECLQACNLSARFKWPNDIYLKGRKAGGILVESCRMGSESGKLPGEKPVYIAGIGINYTVSAFPEEVAKRAISLYGPGKQDIPPRGDLVEKLCRSISRQMALVEAEGYCSVLTLLRNHSILTNKPVVVYTEREKVYGTARDITDDGGLLVVVDGARRVFYAGDVDVRTGGKGDLEGTAGEE